MLLTLVKQFLLFCLSNVFIAGPGQGTHRCLLPVKTVSALALGSGPQLQVLFFPHLGLLSILGRTVRLLA